MSSYEYRVWSIKAKSDSVIEYECEKCGASNISVKTIVGFGSRNDDHQAKWSKSYTNEITNKIVTDMGKETENKVQIDIDKHKSKLEKGIYNCVEREQCKKCGAYQRFMLHKAASLKFSLWLALNMLACIGLIGSVFRAILTSSLIESLISIGLIVPMEIALLIFLLRSLKRVKENSELKDWENKIKPAYYFTPIQIVMPGR